MKAPVFASALLLATASLDAQDTSVARLPAMVTVTRQPARSPLDIPFGISGVTPDSLRPGQAHVAADQTLFGIPGVTVANRTNPSQDVRVSVRGFGARSQFGVRSVKILRDGMPLTLPDGQTPLDYLDLESVGRVEVIRGTAAALYGNASGGVIDIHSVDPPAGVLPEARFWGGSSGLRRSTVMMSGTSGSVSYQSNLGQTIANNYRAFSHQQLENGFARVSTTWHGTALSVTGLGLHMPTAENPGALTQAQLDALPTMADSPSVAKKARKEVDQIQTGIAASRQIGAGNFTLGVYGGARSLYNPQTFAVVDLQRNIWGGSGRADFAVAAVPGLTLTVGGDYQIQDDRRKNWAACNGQLTATANCPTANVEKGVLSLDQREYVTGGGPYARLELERGILRADLGARSDVVRFELNDHFLTDNRNDSGERSMHAVSPAGGLAARWSRFFSTYANYSTAFETPTTTELGNQSDGSAGLNTTLNPQYSHTIEVGAKGILRLLTYDVAGFRTRVRDELIPFQATNGRTYYRNAGATRRDGAEVSGDWSTDWYELGVAYAYSRFRFVDFLSGTTQLAGKQIPGIPQHQLQLNAIRRFRRGYAVAEWQSKSQVWANDANTVAAKRFEVLNLRVGRDVPIERMAIAPMAAVNNLFDRRYAGSVAINATANKFFEPSPGRTFLVGARLMLAR